MSAGQADKVERQRAHFNTIASRYREARQHENHLHLKKRLWRYFFQDKRHLAVPGMSVLEPMCGYGDGKQILEDHLGVETTYEGFDYSDEVVKHLKAHEPALHVYQQDVTTYRPTRQYDVVVIIGALHHVPSHAAAVIASLASAVKPGGHFVSYEPTQNNWLFRAVRRAIYRRNDLFDAETERAFDLPPFNRMFLDAGLEIVDQIYPGLAAFVLYYNPDAFPWLNVGGTRMVDALFALDRRFFRNWIGRRFSFATITLFRKPAA